MALSVETRNSEIAPDPLDINRQYHAILQREEDGARLTFIWSLSLRVIYHTDPEMKLLSTPEHILNKWKGFELTIILETSRYRSVDPRTISGRFWLSRLAVYTQTSAFAFHDSEI
ncbi:nadph dependent diflavin oxidoreductase 1 [Moniliophthora roreri]|nr:nadph dependent diflavin oxidoreductase 1 [Moniliophthora roreri]